MTGSRTACIIVFMMCLVFMSILPSGAADENYWWLWKPTSLGITPLPRAGSQAISTTGAGMRLEEVKVANGMTTITSTGSRFDLSWWPLICAQRLLVERDLVLMRFTSGQVMTVEQLDDFTCQVECTQSSLTFMGDSVMVLKPKMDTSVDLLVLFKPTYQAQQKGCVLAMDAEGGFGVFPTDDAAFLGQKRPVFWGSFGMSFNRDPAGRTRFVRGAKAMGPDGKVAMGPEWQQDFGELSYHLKAGQELWFSIFPPQQPMDATAYAESMGKQDNPYKAPGVDKSKMSPKEYEAYRNKMIERFNHFEPYPGNEIRRLVNIAAFFHNASLQKDLRSNVDIGGSLYRNGGTINFKQNNPLKTPLPILLKWDAPGCQITPPEITLTPAANAAAQTTFALGPSTVNATPRLLVTYQLPGVDGNPFAQTQVYAIPVNETTDVPRLTTFKGLDAMADALKELKPRVIRNEGDDFVETRRNGANTAQEPKLRINHSTGDNSAEIRLAVAGDNLAIHARVFDPRCRPEILQWSGKDFGIAAIDLYVSRPGSTQVRQFHFRALSPTGDKLILANENGNTCNTPTFPCRIVAVKPCGYEVQALIPLKDCLLEGNTEQFLVDIALIAAKGQFKLLYSGNPIHCAYRNNRFFALAHVIPATTRSTVP